MQHENVMDTEMEINQYGGLKYGTDSPGYKMIKKTVKEIAVENYIKSLYKQNATQKKGR